MATADDEELLAPSYTSLSAARLLRLPSANTERSGRQLPRLKVVYDRHFDRFFLQDETEATGKTPPSQSFDSKAERKGSIVHWEDLLLPPRSVTKAGLVPEIKSHEEGTTSDTESHCERDHEVAPFGTISVSNLATQSAHEPTTQLTCAPTDHQEVMTLSSLTPGAESFTSDRVSENPAESTPTTVQQTTTWSKVEAAVLLLRFLRRCIRARRDNRSFVPSEQQAQPPDPSPIKTTVLCEKTPNEPMTALQKELKLDLAQLTPLQGQYPDRKSPKKRNKRVSGSASGSNSYYERHFANAMASEDIPADLNSIQDHDEREIRWQGEVIHVSIDPTPPSRDLRVPRCQRVNHEGQSQSMAHVYELQELIRIRRKPDGFRRVNDGCAFTELTSSSSNPSESERDELSESSSSEDDLQQEFKCGDRVLFYARHRWFKGTVLRRIKKSWFYDVKADNGSIIEAVFARRMRLFDDEDGEFEHELQQGDLVLWLPRNSPNNAKRRPTQTYKARITSIRRTGSSASSHKRAQHSHGHFHPSYDLELRTGRTIKRVPHNELRPLYRHRS